MIPVFLNAPLTAISILGIFFNGYIVAAVISTKQISSANNLLLLHLGVINMVLGLLFLTFSVPGFWKVGWLVNGWPCIFHGFIFTLLHSLILWTICGLNCDRYYAIASPLHYGHIVSIKKVWIGLGAGWMISLIFCFPPLFTVAPFTQMESLSACLPDFSRGGLWYSVLFTAFTLLLPATIIICCNIKILMIARYHRHRIASAIYEVTLSAQVTITHQRNPFFVPTVTAPIAGGPPKFRGRSAILTVVQLVGSLLLLYLPYYSSIMFEGMAHKIHPFLSKLVAVFLCCSPPINGFLYGVKNKSIKKTMQNYWRKKQKKNEVNQEIQARTPSTCGSRRPSLTPGFLNKPPLQRRLSEILIDVKGEKKRRISSWRPSSATSLNSPKEEIQKTSSCTIIGHHDETPPIINDNLKPWINSNILHRILKRKPQDKSPRITITRAISESQSSLDKRRKWREQELWMNRSDDSSENSESGRIFMALDTKTLEDEASEDQLLLAMTSKKYMSKDDIRKNNSKLLKQTLVNVHTQEIVLH